MRSLAPMLAVALVSAVLGGVLGARLGRVDDRDALRSDPDGRLEAALVRLEALERRLAERPPEGDPELALLAAENRAGVLRLEAALRELRDAPRAVPPIEADPVAPDDLAALVDARIVEASRRRHDEERRRQAVLARERSLETGRTIALRIAKHAPLASDQIDRLAEVLGDVAAEESTRWGAIKGEDAPRDDRLAAIAAVRAGWRTADDAARGILDATQFTAYEDEVRGVRAKIDAWLTATEEAIAGGR
ncbi:MAG: hypothetical protein R3F20_15240 [Planctomycetota bacterium]